MRQQKVALGDYSMRAIPRNDLMTRRLICMLEGNKNVETSDINLYLSSQSEKAANGISQAQLATGRVQPATFGGGAMITKVKSNKQGMEGLRWRG
jgi:hypothetical protein